MTTATASDETKTPSHSLPRDRCVNCGTPTAREQLDEWNGRCHHCAARWFDPMFVGDYLDRLLPGDAYES